MVTFYMVGQALFSSESHGTKTIVYDCGGENVPMVRDAIYRAFPKGKNQVIDILFISHYDKDHINGIFYLLKKCTVKEVVFPLVSNLSRFLSFSKYPGNKYTIVQRFYENPPRCIHSISPNTQFTYLIAQNDDRDYENQEQEYVDDANYKVSLKFIHSGTQKHIIGSNWLTIPFNRMVMTKKEENYILTQLGLSPNATFNDLKNTWTKSRAKIIKKVLINNTMITYESINDYSMVLSSITGNSHILYLGDYNTKDHFHELDTMYSKYWNQNKITCLQIPHHGSMRSFNEIILGIGGGLGDFVIPNGGQTSSHKRNYVNPDHVIMKIAKLKKQYKMTDMADIVI